MNPIRPNVQLPATTTRPVRPESRAAQKAFFTAAMGGAAAAAAPQPEPVRAAAASARTSTKPEPEPHRYLRPGSLLDIKV